MFKYELHLHTSMASKCARQTPREAISFYKSLGYDGVFITNHFIDGNIGCDIKPLYLDGGKIDEDKYKEVLDFYFADYIEAKKLSEEIGIQVFLGVEISYKGTDFLIYGLPMEWYYKHPEILTMDKKEELALMKDAGALIVHAHPYREASYIPHIRLYPDRTEGVEVINANRSKLVNRMAELYAKNYHFLRLAGSDCHAYTKQQTLAGVKSRKRIESVDDFIILARAKKLKIFKMKNRFFVKD